MTTDEILELIGPKGAVDLYHITSHPMWLILDGMILLTGDDAYRLRPTNPPFGHRKFLQWEENVNFDLAGWGENGRVRAYGYIYFK